MKDYTNQNTISQKYSVRMKSVSKVEDICHTFIWKDWEWQHLLTTFVVVGFCCLNKIHGKKCGRLRVYFDLWWFLNVLSIWFICLGRTFLLWWFQIFCCSDGIPSNITYTHICITHIHVYIQYICMYVYALHVLFLYTSKDKILRHFKVQKDFWGMTISATRMDIKELTSQRRQVSLSRMIKLYEERRNWKKMDKHKCKSLSAWYKGLCKHESRCN